MRPSSLEVAASDINRLRVLCKAKREATGETDPEVLLHAVLTDLGAPHGRTIAARVRAVLPSLPMESSATSRRLRQQDATDRSNRRRARQRDATSEQFTRAEIILRDNRTCHICGLTDLADDEIHLDHVVPLARGGEHTRANVRVACIRCNLSKGARL